MKKIIFTYLHILIFTSCFGKVFAQDVVVNWNNGKATIDQTTKDSIKVTVDGSHVDVKSEFEGRKIVVKLTGKSDDGTFELHSPGKAKVILDGLWLTSTEGAPLCLKTKKKATVVVVDDTQNTLAITACQDTANHKSAVIYSKDKLHLSGKGHLQLLASGDGCRGIYAKDNITIDDLVLDIKTTGNNLGVKPFGGFGGFGPPPEDMEDMDFSQFGPPEGMDFSQFGPPEGMDFSQFGPPDSIDFEHFGPPEGMGFGGGFAGPPAGEGPERVGGGGAKQKYILSCKGIKSTGTITINSGQITVYTASAGAEGIEGKQGVTINGGLVDINAQDDAINATGKICFNGGKTIALSRGNDAIDANPEMGFFPGPFGGPGEGGEGEHGREPKEQESLVNITAGEVYAYSWVGAPEEGIDSDFSPIGVSGGVVFSIGAGMGNMPSTPTQTTAKQPTLLFTGLTVRKDVSVVLKDSQGKTLWSTPAPFSFNNSSSLLSMPSLKVGERYTIESGDLHTEFKLSENFTIVRCDEKMSE